MNTLCRNGLALRHASRLASLALALTLSCKKEPAANAGDAGTTPLSIVDASASPARGTPIPAAVVAERVNPENLPPYNGPTGSLEGRVTVIGEPALPTNLSFAKCPTGGAARVYEKTFREGPPLPDGSRPLADALVVVTGYSGFYLPEKNEAKSVTIDECAYSTRTLDLTFGQRIEIANRTPGKLFGPQLSNHPMPALMVAPFGGDPVKIWPKEPGYAQVFDKFGVEFLVLDVYTMLQPLHDVTKLDGSYRIDGVPVGTLAVNARLRALDSNATKPVEIRSGVVARVDLVLEHRSARPDAGGPGGDATAPKTRIK